jgi:hypothetical protein
MDCLLSYFILAIFAFAHLSSADLHVAGASLFHIANRLDINQNGCSLPTSISDLPSAPTGLTVTVH